MHNLHNKQVNN